MLKGYFDGLVAVRRLDLEANRIPEKKRNNTK